MSNVITTINRINVIPYLKLNDIVSNVAICIQVKLLYKYTSNIDTFGRSTDSKFITQYVDLTPDFITSNIDNDQYPFSVNNKFLLGVTDNNGVFHYYNFSNSHDPMRLYTFGEDLSGANGNIYISGRNYHFATTHYPFDGIVWPHHFTDISPNNNLPDSFYRYMFNVVDSSLVNSTNESYFQFDKNSGGQSTIDTFTDDGVYLFISVSPVYLINGTYRSVSSVTSHTYDYIIPVDLSEYTQTNNTITIDLSDELDVTGKSLHDVINDGYCPRIFKNFRFTHNQIDDFNDDSSVCNVSENKKNTLSDNIFQYLDNTNYSFTYDTDSDMIPNSVYTTYKGIYIHQNKFQLKTFNTSLQNCTYTLDENESLNWETVLNRFLIHNSISLLPGSSKYDKVPKMFNNMKSLYDTGDGIPNSISSKLWKLSSLSSVMSDKYMLTLLQLDLIYESGLVGCNVQNDDAENSEYGDRNLISYNRFRNSSYCNVFENAIGWQLFWLALSDTLDPNKTLPYHKTSYVSSFNINALSFVPFPISYNIKDSMVDSHSYVSNQYTYYHIEDRLNTIHSSSNSSELTLIPSSSFAASYLSTYIGFDLTYATMTLSNVEPYSTPSIYPSIFPYLVDVDLACPGSSNDNFQIEYIFKSSNTLIEYIGQMTGVNNYVSLTYTPTRITTSGIPTNDIYELHVRQIGSDPFGRPIKSSTTRCGDIELPIHISQFNAPRLLSIYGNDATDMSIQLFVNVDDIYRNALLCPYGLTVSIVNSTTPTVSIVDINPNEYIYTLDNIDLSTEQKYQLNIKSSTVPSSSHGMELLTPIVSVSMDIISSSNNISTDNVEIDSMNDTLAIELSDMGIHPSIANANTSSMLAHYIHLSGLKCTTFSHVDNYDYVYSFHPPSNAIQFGMEFEIINVNDSKYSVEVEYLDKKYKINNFTTSGDVISLDKNYPNAVVYITVKLIRGSYVYDSPIIKSIRPLYIVEV